MSKLLGTFLSVALVILCGYLIYQELQIIIH